MAADPTKPRLIELGALSLRLDPNGAFAREITCAGEELFRGIGFVVRDANWGTPALRASVEVEPAGDGFEARAKGRVEIAGESLDWSIVWTVDAAGLEARAAFSSPGGFSTNRTGFVVLHSLGASRGRAVRVAHPGGAVEETHFPDHVSPHQPFFDIEALEYRTSAGHGVDIAFEGEVFEIEDQRN
jgi:D-apionolactonase